MSAPFKAACLVCALSVCLSAATAWWAWRAIPEGAALPVHFDTRGVPVLHGNKAAVFAALGCALGGFTLLCLAGVLYAHALPARLCAKQAASPPRRWPLTLPRIRRFLLYVCACAHLCAAVLFYALATAACGGTLPAFVPPALMLLPLFFLVGFALWLSRA